MQNESWQQEEKQRTALDMFMEGQQTQLEEKAEEAQEALEKQKSKMTKEDKKKLKKIKNILMETSSLQIAGKNQGFRFKNSEHQKKKMSTP